MGAHSDYTTYTLLLADPVPGLQIVGSDGSWIDVIPAAGNLLMNVGDLLAIWTNDAWPSTLHRVVPMALGAAERRRSVAWFHYPDPDVVVAPLPAFVGDGAISLRRHACRRPRPGQTRRSEDRRGSRRARRPSPTALSDLRCAS
jgi:isopenicillin N synthase-like dioxygenase